MEPLIKFYLVKLDKKIVFQISDQRRREFSTYRYQVDGDDVTIRTSNSPDMSGLRIYDGNLMGEIYLRGNSIDSDFRESYVFFNNNVERDRAYNKILEIFSKWSEYIENQITQEDGVEPDPTPAVGSSRTMRFRARPSSDWGESVETSIEVPIERVEIVEEEVVMEDDIEDLLEDL